MFARTCFDIWREEESRGQLPTCFKELDEYFGGGIPLRKITEFVGIPGSGKTQLCLNLCLNVQIPKVVGGLEGKAMFIDTRQDLNPKRLQELAEHMVQNVSGIELTVEHILKNIFFVNCPRFALLSARVFSLEDFLMQEPELKLIVIDSLSFSLRMIEDVNERTTLLYELHQYFRKLIQKHDVAIVLTNEMTNRFKGGRCILNPALGDTHAHLINERIILNGCGNGLYAAAVGKSRETSRFIGTFEINRNGIRSVAAKRIMPT